MNEPETLIDAVRYYADRKICFETMLSVKWPDGKIVCPKFTGRRIVMASKANCIHEYRGYRFFLPSSGGKAGTGRNKTSSLQIRNGNTTVKQIRFKVGVIDFSDLIAKGEKIIDERRREIRMMS